MRGRWAGRGCVRGGGPRDCGSAAGSVQNDMQMQSSAAAAASLSMSVSVSARMQTISDCE